MIEPLTEERRERLRQLAEFVRSHVGKMQMCSLDEVDRLARGVLALLDERLTPAEAGAIQAVSEVERLRRALTAIAEWKSETFPRVPDREDPTKTYSYGFAYGSNGERDFMRKVAQEALNATTPAEPVFTAAQVREALEKAGVSTPHRDGVLRGLGP